MKSESANRDKFVGISEQGKRCGETHPRARLSDHDVDLIRELRETHGLTYQAIADKFEISKSTVRDLCKYRRRCERPVRWKRTKGVDVEF